MDAILRVAYRRLISHKNLLQWSSGNSSSNGSNHQMFIHQLGLVSFFGIAILEQSYSSIRWPR